MCRSDPSKDNFDEARNFECFREAILSNKVTRRWAVNLYPLEVQQDLDYSKEFSFVVLIVLTVDPKSSKEDSWQPEARELIDSSCLLTNSSLRVPSTVQFS